MANSVLRAFLIGRATADVLRERIEAGLTDLASDLGKSLAEGQESWRAFPDDVMAKVESQDPQPTEPTDIGAMKTDDLQATLDDLRAEVAQLRSELKKYRNQST